MNSVKALSVEERIRGAIYGALVGDALGVPVEFSSRAAREAAPVSDMQGWGVHRQPAGTWSDDGALLLCTAESLLEGFSLTRMGASYVRWMRQGHWAARGEVFDIGGTTLNALSRLHGGASIEEAGETGDEQNGNGSLMRIAPIGLRAYRCEVDIIVAAAMSSSRITHAHPRSQLACGFYCLVLAAIVRGETWRVAYERAIEHMGERVRAFSGEGPGFARLLSGNLVNLSRDEISSSGYVIHTLEAALWCSFTRDTFSDAVLTAVNLGSDTDTTGCVAGALAGAMHGFESIPAAWVDILPRTAEVSGLVDCFAPVCESDFKLDQQRA
jgi:ADP-ribosyl-[dinitrogen reductase] hydrolase